MNYKILKSDILYRGKVFNLRVDEIIYESGNKGIRETAVHNGGSVVIPIKDNGKMVMVRQFRYPLNKFIVEFPAGKLDKDEDPLNCASRELREETGYRSENIVKLGTICTTPGFCSEILHLYLAKDLIPGDHKREEGESGMEIFEFSIAEIEEKIRTGEIIDSKTICGLYLADKYLKEHLK